MQSEALAYSYSSTPNPNDMNYHLHLHNCIELIYFVKGNVSYVIEGQRYEVHPHDIFIVESAVYHRVKIEQPVEYTRFDILLSKEILPDGLADALLSGRLFLSQRASPYIDSLFKKLRYYKEHLEEEAFSNILLSFMTIVLYTMLIDGGNTAPTSVSSNIIVEKALQYIEEHLTEIRSLDEVYSFVNLSKCQFHRIFFRELNITPMKYIKMKRLMIARKALINGEKASKVCYECGFLSYPSFYRAYKEYYGYSPADECDKGLRFSETLS